MTKMAFNNYQSMLHILPGLKRVSESLVADVQETECIEALLKRMSAINTNIQELSECASRLDYQPLLITPLIDALQRLADYSNHLYNKAKNSDYENAVFHICNLNMMIVNFVHCVKEAEQLLDHQNNESMQASAAYG